MSHNTGGKRFDWSQNEISDIDSERMESKPTETIISDEEESETNESLNSHA